MFAAVLAAAGRVELQVPPAERPTLAFGQTVGGGIAAVMGPAWSSGQCLAVGMVKEVELARSKGGLSPDALNRLLGTLKLFGLPAHLPTTVSYSAIVANTNTTDGGKAVVLLSMLGASAPAPEVLPAPAVLRVLAAGVVLTPKR